VARASWMRLLKFFCFPVVHDILWDKPVSLGNPAQKAIAGALCTLPETLTIMPLELVKVGLQLDTSNRYGGSSRAVMQELLQRYGWRSLWVGWVGVQWRQSSWTAVYFATLKSFQDLTDTAFNAVAPGIPLTKVSQLVSGFAAGFSGALLQVPGDLIAPEFSGMC